MQELVATPLEKLVEIPGIGEKTAEKVLATAQRIPRRAPAGRPRCAPAELEFTPEMEPAAGAARGCGRRRPQPPRARPRKERIVPNSPAAKKLRIYEVAKDLGMSSDVIIQIAQASSASRSRTT